MSRYSPKPENVRIVQRPDGWWFDDVYGPIDGPFATAADARAAADAENE